MGTLNEEVLKLGASIPQSGIADAIWKAGGLLRVLPFLEGNGLLAHQWNEEDSTALFKPGPVPIGGAVPQMQAKIRTRSTPFKWFGGDALFDRRSVRVASNIQDAKAAFAIKMAKGLRYDIEAYLFYGDSADTNQFDGLQTWFPGSVVGTQDAQVRGADGDATDGGPLTWDDVDLAWGRLHDDAKVNGVWMCNNIIEAKINALIRTTGTQPQYLMADTFGAPVLMLRGRPVLVNDHLTNTETRGSNTDCGSLWYLGLGEEGVHGRLPLGGNEMITVADMGMPPGYTQDVVRVLVGLTIVPKGRKFVSRIVGIR